MTAASLVADLSRLAGAGCPACGLPLCGHAILISIVAGLKSEPRCTECLAAVLGREPQSLRQHAVSYIRHRDCYLGAWQWASAREVDCPTAAAGVSDGEGATTAGAADVAAAGQALLVKMTAEWAEASTYDAEWDAGEMGCGDLVLELRRRLQAMQPGQVLRVVARDLGAPEDLPAWCAMTGHRLMFARHPDYAIERRRD